MIVVSVKYFYSFAAILNPLLSKTKNMNPTLLKLTAFLLILAGVASSCNPEEPEIKYTLSPTSLNFDATGGKAEFTVSVESPATVESVLSSDTWCQVSANGVSPVNVTVTVDAHTDKEVRKTSVVVNMKSGETKLSATIEITQEVSEWVIIDGIKWATRNVDMPGTFAAKPEDAGMFYQWNRKVGWSATDPLVNSDGGTTWNSSHADAPGNIWELSNDPCPTGWRVPTWFELRSLVNAGSEWTTINGVNGRIFGSGNNSLFLSAAGYRNSMDGTLNSLGISGFYWSTRTMFFLGLDSNYAAMVDNVPSIGISVRCVAE